jgi:hypothetical protein
MKKFIWRKLFIFLIYSKLYFISIFQAQEGPCWRSQNLIGFEIHLNLKNQFQFKPFWPCRPLLWPWAHLSPPPPCPLPHGRPQLLHIAARFTTIKHRAHAPLLSPWHIVASGTGHSTPLPFAFAPSCLATSAGVSRDQPNHRRSRTFFPIPSESHLNHIPIALPWSSPSPSPPPAAGPLGPRRRQPEHPRSLRTLSP